MVKLPLRTHVNDFLELMQSREWYLTSNPFGCSKGYSKLILISKDRTKSITFRECLPDDVIKTLKAKFKARNLMREAVLKAIFRNK